MRQCCGSTTPHPASTRRRSLVAAVLAGVLCWSPVASADGCDPNDSFLIDVVNVICALTGGGLGACINRSDTCTQISTDLFTGATLDVGNPIGPNPKWCELGGRGQIMGEAALCLLRDLAGPGITSSTPPISLGVLGDASVTQRVGFLSFDVPSRTMNGYHDVSLCVPVFGCISDETQPFTASLLHNVAADFCTDYPVTGSYVLRVVAADNEHDLQTTLSPIIVYTPFGTVEARPQFEFGTNLKAVTSPYGPEPPSVNQVRQFYSEFPPCDPPRALLQDTYDDSGVTVTAQGGKPFGGLPEDGGRGWDSQLALGGRDADPNDLLWTPDASKTRPDLDQTRARKADEKKKFVGQAKAAVPIVYDPAKLLPSFLNQYPFHVELALSVTPAIAASFASQFNAYLNEGSFRPDSVVPPDCSTSGIFDATRLAFQSRVDAKAGFSLTISFAFVLDLNVLFGSVNLIDFHTSITPVDTGGRESQDGPAAGATSVALGGDNAVPPASPGYDTFTSFSGGPGVDGAQFVAACLTDPPPPPQPLPEPSYAPGDPNKLVAQAQYPCNVCIAIDKTITACAPKQNFPPDEPCKMISGTCVDTSGNAGCEPQPLANLLVCVPKQGFPANEPCQAINGTCVDTSGNDGCETRAPSPLQAGATVVFPAPQPQDKQWLCDSSSKLGCYDLCSYDPASQPALVVVQSAIDMPNGLNCNATSSGRQCTTAADCDDQNPCTDDTCVKAGEFGECQYTAAQGDNIPCDDGLFCDGTDTCYLGSCSQHTGNPCASGSNPGCCDESAGACRQSCDPKICGNGIIEFGEQCDDGNTVGGDGCSPNCTVEGGFSCTGQPSVCALAPTTPTPTARPTPTLAVRPIPVIPSAAAPAGLLLIAALMWLAYRTTRDRTE